MDSRERWQEDDAAALAERLAALRLLSHDIAEAVASIPDPQSFLDGERAAKAVTHADQMLARLPDDAPDEDDEAQVEPDPLSPAHPTRSPQRLKLRTTADRVLAAIHSIPKPDSFIEADRAARCVLASQVMLTQLYAEPKPGKYKPIFVDDVDDNDPDGRGQWKVADPKAALFGRIDRYTRIAVYTYGGSLWPDGTPYDDKTPTNDALFLAADTEAYRQGEKERMQRNIPGEIMGQRFIIYMITNRVNAIVRANAERTGKWPNGQAYRPDHPDYFFVSKAWDECVRTKKQVYPPDDEQNLPGFPWWMMSRKCGYPDTG